MSRLTHRSVTAFWVGAILTLGGCKCGSPGEVPPAPRSITAPASAAAPGETGAGSTPLPVEPGDEEPQGPMALAFQDVPRPYGDIPMLSLDGTESKLSDVATAKVVFVVPWATIHGPTNLHFAEEVQELIRDLPDAQVLVFSIDRAIDAADREVLQTLIREAGTTVPVWTDSTLKLLSVVHHRYPESRRGTNAMWTAPLTAFSQGLEHVERSHWDDDLPALKEKLRAQVERLVEAEVAADAK